MFQICMSVVIFTLWNAALAVLALACPSVWMQFASKVFAVTLEGYGNARASTIAARLPHLLAITSFSFQKIY